MDEDEKGLADYLEVFRRRKGQMVLPAIVIFVVATVAAFVIPPTYRAKATILIERQEMPSELVQSTITTYADQRIQVISQRVMTSANLVQIIEKFNLYPEERETSGLASVLEQMRTDIRLDMLSADVVDPRTGRPSQATIAFTVSYQSESAQKAQRVTNELVSLYLNENLRSRTESVAETATFLEVEARRLNAEVIRLETEVSAYRSEHSNYLPELTTVNRQQMDRADRQLLEVRQQLRSLEERKIYLEAELAQLQPNAIMYSADGSRIMSPQDRLESLRSEYVGMSARYSDSHPTLIAMRTELKALRNELGRDSDTTRMEGELRQLRADLAANRERYAAQHPDIQSLERRIGELETRLRKASPNGAPLPSSKPDNPAYIQIQAQLRAAEIEHQSLKLTEAELLAKLADLEGRIARAPLVAKDLNRLNRQYQNAEQEYREIRTKERAAELSQSLERDRKGERLSLIEPPLLPEDPEKPNRKAIVFIGFVLAMAGSFGTLALRESMDNTVHCSKDLATLLGEQPLSVIPFHQTRSERRKQNWKRVGASVAATCLIAGGVAYVHMSYMPLDVLWYVVTQRLGIQIG